MNALLQAAALLGLPLLEQDIDGKLLVNDAARALVGAVPSTDLTTTVARLGGCRDDDARLSRALASARDGRAASASLESARVVALPRAAGGLCVLVLATSAEVERRAALVDAAAEVAHEVGNALSAIAGWAELGRAERQRDRIDDAFNLIETSARSARDAARGLLGAAGGRGAVSAGESVATDAAALAVNVGRTLGPLAASRRVRLDTAVGGEAPVHDANGQLWTILWNLTKNALEAATEGGLVELRVTTSPRGVRVTVCDDGPGMSTAARERAFEPYFTTKTEGTGLGLPLVKRSVESLGGTILLEGRRGGGLRAVVVLPRAGTPRRSAPSATVGRKGPRRAPRETVARARAGLAGRVVLVVEDDAALRELIATTLELRGAHVTAVDSGAAARALEGPFEVALIDLTLGDLRGDRVLADLRARGVLRGPAILATGRALPNTLEAEPDAVLRKPFALDEMTELVAGLTGAARVGHARRG